MTTEYKYRFDLRVWRRTVIYMLIFGLAAMTLFVLCPGGYVLAWYISLIVAIMALMVLSIPRKIVVGDDAVEIVCISDHTIIPIADIASVAKVSRKSLRWALPLFASDGFFGYYGRFFDIRTLSLVRIYATTWNDFIEITDIYDERYYVSCYDADGLVRQLTAKREKPQKDRDE